MLIMHFAVDQPQLALAYTVKHLTFVPLVLLGIRNNNVSPFNQMMLPQITRFRKGQM